MNKGKAIGIAIAIARRTVRAHSARGACDASNADGKPPLQSANLLTGGSVACRSEYYSPPQLPRLTFRQEGGDRSDGSGSGSCDQPNGSFVGNTLSRCRSDQSKGLRGSHWYAPTRGRRDNPATHHKHGFRAGHSSYSRECLRSRSEPSYSARCCKGAYCFPHDCDSWSQPEQSFRNRSWQTCRAAGRLRSRGAQFRKHNDRAIAHRRQGHFRLDEARSSRRIGGLSCRSISGSLPFPSYTMTAWESQICYG